VSAVSAAIVLRRVDYGESDLIVTLLCRELGKLSALARGGRRSQRRFGGALGIATVSTVEVRRRSASGELWTLASAQVTRSLPAIAADMGAFAHASYGTELVRELLPPEAPDPTVFDLAVELFETLAERGAIPFVLRAFEIRLLEAIGLRPVLDVCAACGRDPEKGLDRGALLDPHRGGVVCGPCGASSRGLGVRPLSGTVRTMLEAASRCELLADAATAPPRAGGAEARDAMLALLLHHIGKPLRSIEFIAKMNSAHHD
jgi:DNA repair protein RecO (recombination protein O)